MLIKNDQTDGLYGFGAAARAGVGAQKRRNTHMLSFFVVALSTAVLAVMVAVLPIGAATASPLLTQAGNAPHTLGVAAIAAFCLSTIVCAIMLVVPILASRRSRRRARR
ncbi:MAG: hypothetical protein AAFW74_00175 [Pseudomonadota bacterium]